MIDLKPEDVIDWDGFDVYDAKTGEKLSPQEVQKREFGFGSKYRYTADGFALDWEGCFFITTTTGEKRYVPAQGHYIIQLPDGKYTRW